MSHNEVVTKTLTAPAWFFDALKPLILTLNDPRIEPAEAHGAVTLAYCFHSCLTKSFVGGTIVELGELKADPEDFLHQTRHAMISAGTLSVALVDMAGARSQTYIRERPELTDQIESTARASFFKGLQQTDGAFYHGENPLDP